MVDTVDSLKLYVLPETYLHNSSVLEQGDSQLMWVVLLVMSKMFFNSIKWKDTERHTRQYLLCAELSLRDIKGLSIWEYLYIRR